MRGISERVDCAEPRECRDRMWVEGELGQGEGWDTKKERIAETLETAEKG